MQPKTCVTAKDLGAKSAASFKPARMFEVLIHKIHEYEGTVNELTGDGIMALFGAPVALEDAPQRAIRSSLAIHREIAKFSDQLKQEKKAAPSVKMRIGIHTGPVVAGIVGVKKYAYDIWGDTVNLAARMESSSEAGRINISGTTYSLVKDKFNCTYRGKIQAKNKGEMDMYFVEDEIPLHDVIGPLTSVANQL